MAPNYVCNLANYLVLWILNSSTMEEHLRSNRDTSVKFTLLPMVTWKGIGVVMTASGVGDTKVTKNQRPSCLNTEHVVCDMSSHPSLNIIKTKVRGNVGELFFWNSVIIAQ